MLPFFQVDILKKLLKNYQEYEYVYFLQYYILTVICCMNSKEACKIIR